MTDGIIAAPKLPLQHLPSQQSVMTQTANATRDFVMRLTGKDWGLDSFTTGDMPAVELINAL
jgi:hypothetical protein